MPDQIVTEQLTKVFGRGASALCAVDRVDLRVRSGELFGLLGPNGAGKTTTIGMLTTRVVPTSGRAVVGGIDAAREPARLKRHIGVVAQTNTLDRSLTVEGNLYFHGRYFGASRAAASARTAELLARFRLDDRPQAQIAELSGGMAQRLMVARAVFHNPEVLFLDEPTTGLDPQSRLALWELLLQLHAEGQTILLTTHYMEEADRLCDRLAIMDGGRILALDTPGALKRAVSAGSVVTLTVEGDRSGLAEELARLRFVTRADAVDGQVRVFAESTAGLLPALLSTAERLGHHVREVTVDEPTLEAAFIELTSKGLRE